MKLSAITTQGICRQAGTSGGAGNYGAGVHLIRFRVHMNVRGGNFPLGTAEFSALFFIREEWNALTTKRLWPPYCQNPFIKAPICPISGLYWHTWSKPSMPLQSPIGACGVSLWGLPISNRDIAAGGYPIISGWVLIRSPFAHSKRGKHIFPRKIGVMSVRVQICSRKIPGTVATGGDALQGYISNRTFKRWNSLFSGSALSM